MKPYDLEDRLVAFAGDCIFYLRTVPNDAEGSYYKDQLLRASGSSALHYGEAQGTNTKRDFIHKMAMVLKELKESRVALKVLKYIDYGDLGLRTPLLTEVHELVLICSKMSANKQ